MKRIILSTLFAALFTGCVSPVATTTVTKEKATQAPSFPVYLFCFQYPPNPGSLKGEVRLQNGTSKRIKAKVRNGTNPPTEYTVEAGKATMVGYLSWRDLPCSHKFEIVSWE